MTFQASFAAGGRDATGQFMGGTEMRGLAAHRGMLVAGYDANDTQAHNTAWIVRAKFRPA